jgi:hypothetical protein
VHVRAEPLPVGAAEHAQAHLAALAPSGGTATDGRSFS